MAETVKLPVIGPVNRNWVYVGGALIVGIVGYAWWNRSTRGTSEESGELLPEDIPQDREPPPTVVGTQNFDDENVRAIINTNPEWYTAAVEYLSSTGGYDFTFVTITLGKFLARRELTGPEADLVQAAKGAVGEPPQGGPWPIIRQTAETPSTGATKLATPTLRAASPSGNRANLTWNKVTGASYYLIRRASGPGAPLTYASIGTTRTTPPLQRGKTYGYTVRAISMSAGIGSSDWSPVVSVLIPVRKAA